MLVPSEDSNVDNERAASAHPADGARTVPAATASSRSATIVFNAYPVSSDSPTARPT